MSNLDFTIAKVRGMRGKLFEGDRLAALCASPSVEDLAAALAPQEPVGDAVGLQRILTGRHVADLHGILVHLDGRPADLFRWLLRRYQVENLKIVLRCRAAGAGPATVARYAAHVPPDLRLPVEDLMKANDLEGLINRIPVPALRDAALLGLGDTEESGRLFYVEARLDQAFFSGLDERAAALRGEARRHVRSLVSRELDVYNTMLVLRAVFNYGINFNKLRLLLAPFGALVGLRLLEELRAAPGLDAAADLLPAGLVGGPGQPVSGERVETVLWRGLVALANRVYYGAVLDFGAVVAFTYLKRVELANLVRISEQVRQGAASVDIRRRLIVTSRQEQARTA
jgi:vacuolar-type H+-ATPase subunit C/Vma6